MSDENPGALVRQEPMAVDRPVPTVAEMLQGVIKGGITQENAAVMKEMVALYERMEDRNAEKEFARAFVSLQAEMPKVQAKKAVPNKDGTVRYHFAPYEEIMKQVGPMLQANGFTVTFSTDYLEDRLVKSCTLQHVGGHSKTNKFAVKIGSGPPGASCSQADGAASSYAKRFALCDLLNIQIEIDTDARLEGRTISQAQADDLRRRVRETASNEVAFLKFAGAETFEAISTAKFALLDENLTRKERTV